MYIKTIKIYIFTVHMLLMFIKAIKANKDFSIVCSVLVCAFCDRLQPCSQWCPTCCPMVPVMGSRLPVSHWISLQKMDGWTLLLLLCYIGIWLKSL